MVCYRWCIAFVIAVFLAWGQVVNSNCPIKETDYVHQVGQTRFYILQNLKRENCQKNNGHCLDFDQAVAECEKHGMQLARIVSMQALAVVGRPLEKIVEANGLKDTWYWLDAFYDSGWNGGVYQWGLGGFVEFSNILYRPPRPTGVSGFVNWKGEYKPNSNVKQCLSLALPWPGKGDPHGKGVLYGHHTMLDERPCKSRQKRHALCETNDGSCYTGVNDPFVLTEDKWLYFNDADWIFGDRRFIMSWEHRQFKKAKEHCESLGLKLFEPDEGDHNGLIHYLKMWSREVTVSQYWTGYKWNSKQQTYLNRKNQTVTVDHQTKSKNSGTKSNPNVVERDYCVAMVVSYEFKGQLPCKDQTSPNCTWSFVDYIPANCNNFLATICEHKDKRSRDHMWDPSYVLDVDKALKETAVTKEFRFKGNTKVLRSKYKQTFGSMYCPDGYRMLRSKNKDLLLEGSTSEYEYDFKQLYWVVDDELFDKNENSKCTVTELWPPEGKTRIEKKVACTDWYFYLCEQFPNKTSPAPGYTYSAPEKMIWKEGPQPRIYPLITQIKAASVSGSELAGRMDDFRPQNHEGKSRLPPHTNGIFDNWILKSINKTQRGFTILGRSDEYDEDTSPPPKGLG